MLPEVAKPARSPGVLDRLKDLCADRGLDELARRLGGLGQLVAEDMESFEGAFARIARTDTLVEKSGSHLLAQSGKRLRPLCVALASRVGAGFTSSSLDLAVAIELVHSATLLHDDVVDQADTRRGTSSARAEFGNAASIFAGDWLLIEALWRVRRSAVPGAMERLLETIGEMIVAESLQLENRGRLDITAEDYFQVVEGKSASLFRWGMAVGGRSGGLSESDCRALEDFGLELGVAFQVIDDLLDLTGDRAQMGKALFADLREGKLTYPVIVALQRDPSLRPALAAILAAGVDPPTPGTWYEEVRAALRDTGAVEDCRKLAAARCRKAIESLAPLPQGPATTALATVAEAIVNRNR